MLKKGVEMKRLLIITTNSSGDDKIKETGVNLQEFAVPFLVFEKSNIEMTIASPEGGISPVDESSMSCSNPQEWDKCIKILRNTKRLSQVDYKGFDGLYFPGGHGLLFDLVNCREVIKIIEYFCCNNRLISAVCHGPAVFVNTNIVEGKRLTSFTNEEESIIKFKELVPFLLETKLRELGADFIAKEPWSEHVEVDGNLITGQNQNSALLIAEKIVEFLR